jgi:hypothetical protein
MDCRHSDCTLFEGGVDKMPGKKGYDYLMCSNCHKILAYRNNEIHSQWWLDGVYKLGDIWNTLEKEKERNKMLKPDIVDTIIKAIDDKMLVTIDKMKEHPALGYGKVYDRLYEAKEYVEKLRG